MVYIPNDIELPSLEDYMETIQEDAVTCEMTELEFGNGKGGED